MSGPYPRRAPYIFWGSARNVKGFNFFGYENPEAERLFEVLRTSINEAAVRSATRNLQRVLLDDPPAIFLAWNQRSRAVRRDFRVVQEPDRDPLDSIWRWAAADTARQRAVKISEDLDAVRVAHGGGRRVAAARVRGRFDLLAAHRRPGGGDPG